jgi:hypothetical protein
VTSEVLIANAEALLVPLGANPMHALPALARGRTLQVHNDSGPE